MKKKVLLITIPSVIIVFLAIFLGCFFGIPRLEYEYNSEYDGYLVSKAYGDAKSYYVPASYNDKPIVGFSTRAFFRHSNLESIEYEKEDNIRFIGRLAFSECGKLKDINIEYATTIERNAFSYDVSLTTVTLGAENIGASVFYGCSSITTVNLNTGVKSIGQYAFSHCSSLEEVSLPNTVVYVYDGIFNYSGVKRVYCSSSLIDNEYLSSLDYVIYG